ncbi:MAG: hypothetical protein ABIK28_18335, partial [Planctomycetota bacterium]
DSVKEGIQRTGERLLQEEFNKQLDQAYSLANEKLDEAEKRLDGEKEKLEQKLGEKLKDKLGDSVGENIGKDVKDLLGVDGKAGEEEKKDGLLNQARDLLGGKKDKEKKK